MFYYKYRPFNFRFFFFAAITVIAGIFIASGIFKSDYVTVIAAGVAAVVSTVLCFLGIKPDTGSKVKILSFILFLGLFAAALTTLRLSAGQGADYGFSFMAPVRDRIRSVLFKNLDSNEAGLTYALITGDKTYISYLTRHNFSAAGISHVLAVSGLHVGFLTVMLTFLLKKLRVNRVAGFIILTAVLAFFCMLCSMSASVMRAAIMGVVASLAVLTGRRYDQLDTLSLAAVILLLVNPLLLFDLSFQMSFTAVFGIVLFARPLTRLLKKIKMPDKAATAVAVTVSASIGIYPVTAAAFGVIPVYSVLANILIIPLISVLFIAAFIGVLITLIFPFTGVLLNITVPIAWVINVVSQFFASLPFSTLAVYGMGGAAALFYALLLFTSRFALALRAISQRHIPLS